ncbi:MAG: polyphosphate kinase 2 family protein [Methylibium sp.]|uniref:PPK2 family polyphosphate kinase n=1 Tax=Methylibium sp. TaxID=2067992 RepID=UPI001859B668|nr:PPK2 family polyphosphate kinase [Methylibium sp.]MBA3599389.1 polyphosphate kinase 2 family protein [Methylibium sp.]
MARHRNADPFEPFRVGRKLRLKNFDPAEKPFSIGTREADDARLTELAVEIDRLQDLLYANGTAGAPCKLLVVLQGLDTSGKDGTARAVFTHCSPLGVRVSGFRAPSEIERAHDFLWRVHQLVPRAGEIAVFNRSHYEDVLVPVVEGWIDGAERDRRLAQINDFERLLVETGTTVVKCFLHISRDEQKERLQARLDNPAKQWKFHADDLTVRAKWKHYAAAYETALAATSTKHAPWYVIPADSKSHRNLMIASLVAQVLAGMNLVPPAPDYDPKTVQID